MSTNGMYNATLLVVNTESRPITQWLTDSHQFKVESLRQPDRIFDRVRSLHPDVVLLGFTLPDVNSLTVCQQLKNDTKGFLPVIMTGVNSPADATASLKAGADELLSDTLSADDMVARVQMILRLKRKYDSVVTENRQLGERMAAQKKQIDDALGEIKQMREMSDNIIYNLGHELRTPLLQIKSSVSMLRTDGREGGPDFTDSLIKQATQATARLEDVVNNLNEMIAAMQPPRREPFRVQDAVHTAMRQLSRRWSSSNDVGRIVLHTMDAPLVLGDRKAISQVIQQVIDNALKFSPNGGTVDVRIEVRGECVRVSIQDRGIGIAEENRDRIFRAFYQVDSSTSRPFGGAGVGLTIVKKLMDGMNIPIIIESAPKKGSTFAFDLPLVPPIP